MRLCLAHGTWQLIMLAAALREAEKRGVSAPQPTRLLLIECDEIPDLRRGMESLAQHLFSWQSVDWANELLPMRPSDNEWPLDLENLFSSARSRLALEHANELWLNQYTDFPQKVLIEAYPSAKLVIYEEGMMTYTPHHVMQRQWRSSYRELLELAALAIRGKLLSHLQSLRICNWRLDPAHLRRIAYIASFLYPSIRPAYPYDRYPILQISCETLRATLQEANARWPVMQNVCIPTGVHKNIVFLDSAFYLRQRISAEDEAALYYPLVEKLLKKGYRVFWKIHPRDREKLIIGHLKERFQTCEFLELMVPSYVPIELVCLRTSFRAAVSCISTSLLYLRQLFDIPTYGFGHHLPDSVRRGGDEFVADLIEQTVPPIEELF